MTSSVRAGLAVLALLLAFLPVSATASTRQVADPDDTDGRLDVVTIGHTHTTGGLLRHTLRTQRRWPSALLADGTVSFVFRVGTRFRTLDVRLRNGRLVGRICTDRTAGGGGLVACSRDVGVSRPNRRALQVTLAEGLVQRDMTAYRWQVVTLLDQGEGACDDVVCADQVPDDGRFVRHRV